MLSLRGSGSIDFGQKFHKLGAEKLFTHPVHTRCPKAEHRWSRNGVKVKRRRLEPRLSTRSGSRDTRASFLGRVFTCPMLMNFPSPASPLPSLPGRRNSSKTLSVRHPSKGTVRNRLLRHLLRSSSSSNSGFVPSLLFQKEDATPSPWIEETTKRNVHERRGKRRRKKRRMKTTGKQVGRQTDRQTASL